MAKLNNGTELSFTELMNLDNIIILDIRDYNIYKDGYLRTAENLNIPNILFRRLKRHYTDIDFKLNDYLFSYQKIKDRKDTDTIILYEQGPEMSDTMKIYTHIFSTESTRLVGYIVGGFEKILKNNKYLHIDKEEQTIQPTTNTGYNFESFNYISKNFAIGGDMIDSNFVKSHGFTHILNVSSNDNNEDIKSSAICLWKKMDDSMDQDLTLVLPDVLQFIKKALSCPNNKIYVHCHMGISRSVSVSIAYFMWSENMSFDEAIMFISNQRTCACPNFNFLKQLKNMELHM
jgi:serine/threonine/tyrosine-interacting-like protein 1